MFDNCFVFSDLQKALSLCLPPPCPVKYSDVIDFGRKASEKYGTDPEKFREYLGRIKTEMYEKIKDHIAKGEEGNVDISSYYTYNIYCDIECTYLAILQLNIELPGYLKNFPEVQEYRDQIKKIGNYSYRYQFQNKLNSYISGINKYSGKHDLKWLKMILQIKDKDLEIEPRYHQKCRVEDYVSFHLPEILKKYGPGRIRDYLEKNYIWSDVLLPDDYKKMCLSLGVLEEKEIDWIDTWFKNEDNLLGGMKIGELSPNVMRRINKVRIG